MRSAKSSEDDGSTWPYGAMLGFGYFGASAPEGRRHRNRSIGCLAVFVLASNGAVMPALPWAVRVLCAMAIPLAWVGILWSCYRYLGEIDELSRLIQLEAAALSYGAVLVLSSLWFALVALGVVPEQALAMSPRVVFPAVLFVEFLRGIALVLLARARR